MATPGGRVEEEPHERYAMNRITTITGAGLLAAMCCLAVASVSSIDEEKNPAVDHEEYKEFMAHQVADVYDLEQYFVEEQYFFLPMTPPAEDFILRQPGSPSVLPFTWEQFPAEFVKGLSLEYENSVPVYPVTILEDPTTRETVFLNADGKELYALPPAPGYDPYAYLQNLMPLLYSGRYTSDEVYYWQKLYDPSRVQIKAKLIPAEYVEPYLYVADRIEEEAAALAAESDDGGGIVLLRSGVADSNIVIEAFTLVSNGMRMAIGYPNDFTNRLEIYTCDDLLAFDWVMVATNLSTAGTNEITWLDTVVYPESDVSKAYSFSVGNADFDSDGDGLPDAREYFVYHSSTNLVDTDGDGMSDGNEASQGFDPSVSNASALVWIKFPENGRRMP